jgi:nucleotide-binding universal stress UspA family protein
MRTVEHPVVAGCGSADSAGAVELGGMVAGAVGEPLVLAAAYEYEPVALSARGGQDPANERRYAAAESRARRAHRLLEAGIDVREQVVPAVGAGEALLELARSLDACLIALGRDLHGHVTRSVLAHAPCPVAVSPFSVALPGERLETLGVAYDGSPPSRVALIAAGRLAAAAGARLELLWVAPSIDGLESFDEATASVAHGVEVRARALRGDPGEQLVAASEELDLLLCGSHGRGRALAAVLGSVSARLTRSAHCPIVVTPPRLRPDAESPLGISTAGRG